MQFRAPIFEFSNAPISLPFSGKLVFTNGVFDILHAGHVNYLIDAAQLGDYLVVGVNSDSSVKTLNKAPNRPIIPQQQRAELIAALKCVAAVVVFNESTPLELIQTLKPNVLVKGGDYSFNTIVGAEFVRDLGGTVTTIPLTEGFSTTAIIQKIQHG